MRGANSAIQLAAALDRRGVTASIHWEWVYVWLRDCEPIVIKPSTRVPTHEVGRMWAWDHNGNYWSHPRDDWEGVAEIVANYIAEDRAFVATAARLRVDHMAGRVLWDDQPRQGAVPRDDT